MKVKVTLEGQMIKWYKIELIWAIISTFIHGFQNELAQLFCSGRLKVKVTLGGQKTKLSYKMVTN